MSEAQDKVGAGRGKVEEVQPREILRLGLEEEAGQKDGAKERALAKELDPLQKVGFKLALTFFGCSTSGKSKPAQSASLE